MASPTAIGSEVDAAYLYTALVGAGNDSLPSMDLDDAMHVLPWETDSEVLKPVQKLEITEVVVDFKALMAGYAEELKKEFEAGRITGAKYAETYIALTQTAMQNAVQFVLGKDQAFWMAAKTQADAITANNQNEIARLNAALAKANFALTKLKLATEDSQFGQGEYQRLNILPAQLALVSEQKEAQRAQTMDTRSNGTTPVAGIMGSQKSLYDQQKASYVSDTKIKAARVFADLWVTRKTVDDGTETPDVLDTNSGTGDAAYGSIFTALQTTAGGDGNNDVITDPGNGQAIPVIASGTCLLTTAGAETRTLAAPTFVGQRLALIINVDGGSCVITVASAINQAGNTIITMADVKDMILLQAMKVANVLVWREIKNDGCVLS